MSAIMHLEKVTFWHGYGTLTRPHTDSMENMMCMFVGYKNFTIVPMIYRDFVYSGYNGIPRNYSPLEFVAPDYEKFPDFKNAKMMFAHIGEGDCLYNPAYFYHQVASSPDVTLGIATWYETA